MPNAPAQVAPPTIPAAAPATAAAAQAEVALTKPPVTITAEPTSRTGKGKQATAAVETRQPVAATAAHAAIAAQGEAPAAELSAETPLKLASFAGQGDPEAAAADIEQPAAPAPAHTVAEHRQIQAAAAETPRATPQTVALLAAQIANKIDGKATRFDVQLDPHGLGRVDVRVEIGVRGDISAVLNFENPHSAAELRGKSGELQAALEQAGFDLSKASLSFSSGGQGQQQSLFDQQQQNNAPVWRGRAFNDLSDTPETALAPVQRRAAAGGVDVRI